MDSDFNSQSAIVTEEDADRNEKIKKGTYLVAFIFFIGSFIGHVVTIALGVPMFRHCYKVALVVMILGSALGLLQQVPEFFRNFIKLKPENKRYIDYFFGLVVLLRVIWLITATVIIVNADCDNITPAWVCISINWGMLGFFVIIIFIVTVVKFVKKRN